MTFIRQQDPALARVSIRLPDGHDRSGPQLRQGTDFGSRLFRHDLSVPPEIDGGAVVTSGLAGDFSGST